MQPEYVVLVVAIAAGLIWFSAVGMAAAPGSGLEPTLALRELDGVKVPFQNGWPLPSFEPQDRPTLSLGGEWRSLRERADHGLTMSRRDAKTLAKLEEPGYHRPDFDDSGWSPKMLPAVENSLPGQAGGSPERYEDAVWYRRRFIVPEEWNGRFITLNFLAVNYVADVWLNGRYLGWHEGGYTPFSFPVAGAVLPGRPNTLVVRVDNPPWGSRLDTVPAVKSTDWWNYTGIIQDVFLESLPAVHVVRGDVRPLSPDGSVEVRLILANSGAVEVTVDISLAFLEIDPGSPGFLTDPRAAAVAGPAAAAVGESSRRITLAPGTFRAPRFRLRVARPRLWSPAMPDLYVLSVSLRDETGRTLDRYATQFGIRFVGAEGAKFVLNGKPTLLLGVARHEDWPDTGRTASWERIRQDLELIKELGANFLRTAHYPNHPYTYLLTDRLGLMVMEEIPVWQFSSVEFIVQSRRLIADQMWREMIFGSYNRPSVVIWSAQNEGREVKERASYIARIAADWRANYIDGRLLSQSAAADAPGPADASQGLCDLAGWTMYFGIFHGSTYHDGTADFLDRASRHFPDKPILATEFGLWSFPDGRNHEEQRQVFRETMRAFIPRLATGTDGCVAGMIWWTAFDWFSTNTGLQSMGLCGMDRISRKPVWDDLARTYRDLVRPSGGGT
ncbi:MAG: glycoside hydrolase family 2 protein, partial [Bacteroidota bacterium]